MSYSPAIGDKGVIEDDGTGAWIFSKAATPTLNDKGGLVPVPGGLPVFIKAQAPAVLAKGILIPVPGSLPVFISSVSTPSPGTLLAKWSTLANPYGLWYDPNSGNVFVVDPTANLSAGAFAEYTAAGAVVIPSTSLTGNPASPNDVMVDSSGNIYVVGQYYIVKYNSSLVYQTHYHLTSFSSTAQRCAIDTSNSLIYVSTVVSPNSNVDVYNLSGVWQRSLDSVTGTAGYHGIALDSAGNVYICYSDGTVTKFSSAGGAPIWAVTPPIIGGLAISGPLGLAYVHDHIYMSDSGNNRILIFDSAMTYQSLWNSYNDGGTIKNFSGLTDIVGDTTTGHIFVGNAGTSEILKLQGLTS